MVLPLKAEVAPEIVNAVSAKAPSSSDDAVSDSGDQRILRIPKVDVCRGDGSKKPSANGSTVTRTATMYEKSLNAMLVWVPTE